MTLPGTTILHLLSAQFFRTPFYINTSEYLWVSSLWNVYICTCLILLLQVNELAAVGKSWVSWVVDKLISVLHGSSSLPDQGVGDSSCMLVIVHKNVEESRAAFDSDILFRAELDAATSVFNLLMSIGLSLTVHWTVHWTLLRSG